MTFKILFINPNSTQKVTDNLKSQVKIPLGFEVDYYTAPPASPSEITDTETSILSCKVVLPDLLEKELIKEYDGFLVGCYSDHPLVHSISKYTTNPVLGIMQATILYALSKPSVHASFILTSVSEWEKLLDDALVKFLGAQDLSKTKFLPTRALNVGVTNLANEDSYKTIKERFTTLLKEDFAQDDVDCVLLGCAGMAGLDHKLANDYPNIKFVDSVKIGIELLSSLVRYDTLG